MSSTIIGIKTVNGVLSIDSKLRMLKILFFFSFRFESSTSGAVPHIKPENNRLKRRNFVSSILGEKINWVKIVRKISANPRKIKASFIARGDNVLTSFSLNSDVLLKTIIIRAKMLKVAREFALNSDSRENILKKLIANPSNKRKRTFGSLSLLERYESSKPDKKIAVNKVSWDK